LRVQLFITATLIALFSTAQTKIEILGADQLVYNKDVGKFQRCIGNVRFKQGQMFMDCDSARFYEEVNKVEAFGNIYIRQPDTLDLRSEYLEYDGDLRLAKVTKNVKLKDDKMTLTTDQLNYDMNEKIGYYSTGGNINNGRDKLYSKKGTYYSRSKEFFFKEDVKLSNEEYDMTSDTLQYNTVTETAFFYGPTYIVSEENTIYCEYGWYNTDEEISQFSQNSYILGKENKLNADSMVYFRNSGLGEAFGNIVLVDTVQDVTITGDYGKYNRLTKTTLVSDNPVAITLVDGDSFYLKADTLMDFSDTTDNGRIIKAYHNTKIFKSDMQGVCDSLIYSFSDSTIKMFVNPVIWADSNQITGDTMIVYRNSEGIERLETFNNGFLIEKDANGLFNQIKGKQVTAFFNESKLNKVFVNGNGRSIYYALEDSTQYSGVNDIICGNMLIRIDSTNRVRTISFYLQPVAAFYPLEQFPENKSRLETFEWKALLKPKKQEFLKSLLLHQI
jgi:lipopolysaccharide export system protein LptA